MNMSRFPDFHALSGKANEYHMNNPDSYFLSTCMNFPKVYPMIHEYESCLCLPQSDMQFKITSFFATYVYTIGKLLAIVIHI